MDATRPAGSLGSTLFWLLVLALGVAATQVRSFGVESWQTDEHVFILMAAHVLDGGLPGIELMDIKPPLFFYMLAATFAVFGESLGVARLFGDFATFALCAATFAVARRWVHPAAAGLGALAVVAATAGWVGQATLTDQPAMALLMAGMLALLVRRQDPWVAGCAGFLVSAAVLVRLNLVFLAAAMGLWLASCTRRHSQRPMGWGPLLAFATAGFALPALFVLLYWRADALDDLRFWSIDMPLSYGARTSISDSVPQLLGKLWDAARNRPLAGATFAVAATAGVVTALQRLSPSASGVREATQPDMADELLLATMVVAGGLAIVFAGGVLDHYLFMLVPSAAVYAARGAERAVALARHLPTPWPARAVRGIAGTALAGVAGLLASVLQDRATQPRPVQPIRLAAEAIAADRQPSDGVWPIDHDLASWYLDINSPIPLAFSFNLVITAVLQPLLDSGRLPAWPLRAAMATEPVYLLVRSNNGSPFRPPLFIVGYDAGEAATLTQWVRENYALFYDAAGVAVYKTRARS